MIKSYLPAFDIGKGEGSLCSVNFRVLLGLILDGSCSKYKLVKGSRLEGFSDACTYSILCSYVFIESGVRHFV